MILGDHTNNKDIKETFACSSLYLRSKYSRERKMVSKSVPKE